MGIQIEHDITSFDMVNAGGGGHSPHILVGMCHGKVKKGGGASSSVKMRVSAWSELEREKWGSPELTVGRVWLALWPTDNHRALPGQQ